MIAVIFLQSGSTSLHVASQHGHVQMVEMLIRSGADVDVVNKVSFYIVQNVYTLGSHVM